MGLIKCTIENALRSDEILPIGKRLLSNVAKPIDGMLDIMLDRLSFEISENIEIDNQLVRTTRTFKLTNYN